MRESMNDKENQTGSEKQPMPRRKKTLIIVGAVVLALAVLVVAYAIWERPPEVTPAPAPTATPAPTPTPDPTVKPADAPEDPAETP